MRVNSSSLKTGGLIIGVLETIVGIIGAIVSFVVLVSWASFGLLVNSKYLTPVFEIGKNSALIHNVHFVTSTVFNVLFMVVALIGSSIFIMFCSQIIISVVLIYGIRKNSKTLMTVWTVFKIIYIVLLLIAFAVMCILSDITAKMLATHILSIGLSSFYVVVILKLKQCC